MDIELEDGTLLEDLPDDIDPAIVQQLIRGGDIPDATLPANPDWKAPDERLPFTELMQRGDVNPDKLWAHSAPEIGGAMATGGALNVAAKVPSLLRGSPALASIMKYVGESLSRPTGYGQAATGGAVEGAMTAASAKDATKESIAKGAAAGAVAGTIGQRVFGDLGGLKVDDRAQKLIDRGVDVTTGGRLGPGWRATEDKLTSVPLLGDAVIKAKERERSSFNRVIVNDALKSNASSPIPGSLVPEGHVFPANRLPGDVETGAEAIKFADDQISKGYRDTLDSIAVKSDDQFKAEVQRIRDMVLELPPEVQKRTMRIIDRNISGPMDNPTELLLGQTFKKSYSDLGTNARQMSKSQDLYMKDAGLAVAEVRKSLKDLNARQNPAQAEALAGLDKSFAKMKVVKGAAKLRGADDQIFTPAQYLGEVNKTSTGDNFVHGEAFNQDIAADAKAVMTQKVPDSGTAGRAMMGSAIGGGAIAAGSFAPTAAGLLAGAAAYSKPGQRALNSMLFKREADNLLKKSTGALPGLMSANAAAGLMD